jgi:hypothetical protein
MSQKNLSNQFNAYAGKVINLEQFDFLLGLVQQERNPLAKAKDFVTRNVVTSLRKRQALEKAREASWPVVYTHDTETEEALTEKNNSRFYIGSHKTFFEAASFMAALEERSGCLTKSFRKTIELCPDHRTNKTLSEAAAGENDTGFEVCVNSSTGKVAVKAYVEPKQQAQKSDDGLSTYVMRAGKSFEVR